MIDLYRILRDTPGLNEQGRKSADNVMEVFTRANTALVERQIKEDSTVCNAVDELFAKVFADDIKKMQDMIADKDSLLADKDSLLADKDSLLADKDKTIAYLQAQLDRFNKSSSVKQG